MPGVCQAVFFGYTGEVIQGLPAEDCPLADEDAYTTWACDLVIAEGPLAEVEVALHYILDLGVAGQRSQVNIGEFGDVRPLPKYELQFTHTLAPPLACAGEFS